MERPLTKDESKSVDSQYVRRGGGNIEVREVQCKNISPQAVNKWGNIPEIVHWNIYQKT